MIGSIKAKLRRLFFPCEQRLSCVILANRAAHDRLAKACGGQSPYKKFDAVKDLHHVRNPR